MSSAGTSLHRLADTQVLIGVTPTPDGPQPLFTDVDGESAVVAWTDLAEAQAQLPETHRLFSILVAELAAQLPPHAGLVVDPHSAAPAHVPAASTAAVVEAARPFPAGASTRIGDPAQEPEALLDHVRSAAPRVPALRRAWRTWYQVEDARPKLLLVHESDATDGDPSGDLLLEAAQATGWPTPLLVMALADLPAPHRDWLVSTTPPFYEAS